MSNIPTTTGSTQKSSNKSTPQQSVFNKIKSFILSSGIPTPTIVCAVFAIVVWCCCCFGCFDIDNMEVSPIITFTGFINAFIIAANKVIQEAAGQKRHGISIASIGGRAKQCNKLISHILILMLLSIFCATFSKTTFPKNANNDTGKPNYTTTCESSNTEAVADNRDGNMADATNTSDVIDDSNAVAENNPTIPADNDVNRCVYDETENTSVNDHDAAVSSSTVNESNATGDDALSQEELRTANDGSTNEYGNPENQTADGRSTTDVGAVAKEISVFKYALLAIWLVNIIIVSWLIVKTYELQNNKEISDNDFLKNLIFEKGSATGDSAIGKRIDEWGDKLKDIINLKAFLPNATKPIDINVEDELVFLLTAIFGIKNDTINDVNNSQDPPHLNLTELTEKQAELSTGIFDMLPNNTKKDINVNSILGRTVKGIHDYTKAEPTEINMSVFSLCLDFIANCILGKLQPKNLAGFICDRLTDNYLKPEQVKITARFYLYLSANISKKASDINTIISDFNNNLNFLIPEYNKEEWFPGNMINELKKKYCGSRNFDYDKIKAEIKNEENIRKVFPNSSSDELKFEYAMFVAYIEALIS